MRTVTKATEELVISRKRVLLYVPTSTGSHQC